MRATRCSSSRAKQTGRCGLEARLDRYATRGESASELRRPLRCHGTKSRFTIALQLERVAVERALHDLCLSARSREGTAAPIVDSVSSVTMTSGVMPPPP